MIHTKDGVIEMSGDENEIGADFAVIALEFMRKVAETSDNGRALGVVSSWFYKAMQLYSTKDYEVEILDGGVKDE